MQMYTKTKAEKTISELSADMHAFEVATILLDLKLKLITKSVAAVRLTRGLRIGTSIAKRFSPEAYDSITALKVGESCYIDFLCNDEPVITNVTRCVDGYFLLFNPFDGEIRRRVDEIYSKMSGYDTVCVEDFLADGIQLARLSRFSNSAERLLSDMRGNKELPFFDVRYFVAALAGRAFKKATPAGKGITCSVCSGSLNVEGSPLDFLLIGIFAVSFCLDVNQRRSVLVHADRVDGMVELTVGCKRRRGDDCSITHTLPKHWLHLMRLIADGNLWDIRVGSDNTYSFRLTISMRHVAPGAEFSVRERNTRNRVNALAYLISTLFEFNEVSLAESDDSSDPSTPQQIF
ncbi:MAG: hypothetical protein IKK70_00605 [Clostridia bacterium]|nr:hypothetical protein [Clostridia bacterium]